MNGGFRGPKAIASSQAHLRQQRQVFPATASWVQVNRRRQPDKADANLLSPADTIASMNYWLLKSEPTSYSIADLARDQAALWDGVRNYQARNFLRSMQVGDRAFFYHSNAAPPGIAGLTKIIEVNLADPTQFDSQSPYFDPKSTPENPRWQTVKVGYEKTFPRLIGLDELKQKFTAEELSVVRSGNRLSVMPVDVAIAQRILVLVEST